MEEKRKLFILIIVIAVVELVLFVLLVFPYKYFSDMISYYGALLGIIVGSCFGVAGKLNLKIEESENVMLIMSFIFLLSAPYLYWVELPDYTFLEAEEIVTTEENLKPASFQQEEDDTVNIRGEDTYYIIAGKAEEEYRTYIFDPDNGDYQLEDDFFEQRYNN
ncbi:hypothetical protein [Thalassobacillus sp. CUG 92003]|uniref:hypothetical protein n=1 Tax=Thalassobacillus sp. CUG 92003 TaxID=2736641 RepID=UPI0015E6C5E3|nr:hypothetical protein [Thalassobacillus sp. CUG 92003]